MARTSYPFGFAYSKKHKLIGIWLGRTYGELHKRHAPAFIESLKGILREIGSSTPCPAAISSVCESENNKLQPSTPERRSTARKR